MAGLGVVYENGMSLPFVISDMESCFIGFLEEGILLGPGEDLDVVGVLECEHETVSCAEVFLVEGRVN